MIALSLETWVSLGSLLAVGVALFAQVRLLRAEVTSDIRRLDDRISARISALDDRISARISAVDDRISALDDRVYALAVGLKPQVERVAERHGRTSPRGSSSRTRTRRARTDSR